MLLFQATTIVRDIELTSLKKEEIERKHFGHHVSEFLVQYFHFKLP